jgi:hypothetical protein
MADANNSGRANDSGGSAKSKTSSTRPRSPSSTEDKPEATTTDWSKGSSHVRVGSPSPTLKLPSADHEMKFLTCPVPDLGHLASREETPDPG